MGNTPVHHKRRLSGEECRMTGATPTYLSVTIPPSKRRNMHSMTDLSKSAPPDYSDESVGSDALTVADLLVVDRMAIDEATSMMRAASLCDSINHNHIAPATGGPSLSLVDEKSKPALNATCKPRPASTGHPSPPQARAVIQNRSPDVQSLIVTRQHTHTSPSSLVGFPAYGQTAYGMGDSDRKCPTVFRWNGGGKDIYVSGTFNNWEKRIPMVKRESGVYVIIDCTPGMHEYKYFIDGAWYHDPTKPTVDNDMGTKNNVVQVKPSDFDVIQALESDQANSRHRSSQLDSVETDSLGHSPPGDYSRYIPAHPSDLQRRTGSLDCRSSGPVAPGIGTVTQPPLLPPHLLQGILNMDTGVHCDPNLLPPPNHVIVNHLYALSIKDGVIVLSVISRYRQKFVSTVFYKPIQD